MRFSLPQLKSIYVCSTWTAVYFTLFRRICLHCTWMTTSAWCCHVHIFKFFDSMHTYTWTYTWAHSLIPTFIYINLKKIFFYIYAICVLLVLHRQWSYCGLELFVLASVWSWWPGRWRLHENRYVCLYVKLNVQSLIYTELAGCQIISACYCEQLAIKIQAI